jgi:tRNA nucleotidyltransferase/poly(A) polymerase
MTEDPFQAWVGEWAAGQGARVVSHPSFLTCTLHFPDGTGLDVATARRERYARPGALPAVQPATLRDDFVRRDFTVNAMALWVTPSRWGEVEDPLGGRADLDRGEIRVLHEKSFLDDPTRLYRAARYAGRYGWKIRPATLDLIQKAVGAKAPESVSPARRGHELAHLLGEKDPRPALDLLWEWGLWKFWEPRWKWNEALRDAFGPETTPALRRAALAYWGSVEGLKFLQFPRVQSRRAAQAARAARRETESLGEPPPVRAVLDALSRNV